MENKLIDLVINLNSNFGDQLPPFEYVDNGTSKAVMLCRGCLFEDENGTELAYERTLSRLTRYLRELSLASEGMLSDEVDAYFKQVEEKLLTKFPDAKFRCNNFGPVHYTVSFLGNYNDELMEEFAEDLKEEFTYIFDGLELEISC